MFKQISKNVGFKRYVILLVFVLATSSSAYTDIAGPHKVAIMKYDWRDASHNRDVPVKIYYPADGNTSCPVIIFSHGLGGSRDGYEYLGRHWASWGYVSVHVQHKGSDSDAVKNADGDIMLAMKKSAADPHNFIDRPKDISFAIDRLETLNTESGIFKNRLDMHYVGVAGHSFGAYTTLAVAGQQVGGWLFHKSFADPRVKAIISMSAPANKLQKTNGAYDNISLPCMHMTGTLDESVIGNTAASDRRIPFDCIKASGQYLITFNGGDHMIFSGQTKHTGAINDEHFQSLIKAATTAFWDAYLKDDAKAKVWLNNGDLKKLMGNDASVEIK